jgi:hypothetical protein
VPASAIVGPFRRAVVDTLIRTLVPAAAPGVATEVHRFVDEQLGRAPRHVRLGVGVIETLLAGVVHRGFVGLGPDERAAVVERWNASPLPPVRVYLKLMRSLVLLCGYELQPTAARSA